MISRLVLVTGATGNQGRAVTKALLPMGHRVRAQFADTATMYESFDRAGFAVDIEALRRDYPEVGWTSFEQWVAAQDWGRVLDEAAGD